MTLTWMHYLGATLFVVAVIGILWMAWQQASAADVLAARHEAELERKQREWVNKVEARRARLRDAERRGLSA